MDDPPAVKILVLARHEATSQRWAKILAGSENEVRAGSVDPPDSFRPELIVTDQDGPDDPYAEDPVRPKLGLPDAGQVGVIRIGGQGPGDVRLPVDVTARELRLACRLLARIVRLRRNERARAGMHRRLVEEALTDPLTALPNRRAWDRTLPERLADVGQGAGRQLCLAILDLDHFKSINDRHGHTAGDAVLRLVGRLILQDLRADDFIARLGGDEFGLLLSVPHETAARAVIDRVRGGLPGGLAGHQTHAVTASAGYCLAPSKNTPSPLPSPGDLFALADAALREAKRQGRDRTVGSAGH